MIKKKKAAKRVKKVPKKKAKKPAKKKAAKKPAAKKVKAQKPIGVVTHFYTHIKVAVIKFKVPFRSGKPVHFKGATTDFTQALSSMQYEHKPISVAKKGQSVGAKVAKRVREGDKLYLPE